VVQLAKDLQGDFYPHFKDFFIIIASLLRIQDASLIEVSISFIRANLHLYTASIHHIGLSVQISVEVSAEGHWRCIFVSL